MRVHYCVQKRPCAILISMSKITILLIFIELCAIKNNVGSPQLKTCSSRTQIYFVTESERHKDRYTMDWGLMK